MNTLELFGKRIKEIRKSKYLTQEKLAELIDVDPIQVCRIENGACFTTFETLNKIAKALNIEIYELFKYEHKKSKETLISEISNILQNTSEDEVQLIYKIIKTVLF